VLILEHIDEETYEDQAKRQKRSADDLQKDSEAEQQHSHARGDQSWENKGWSEVADTQSQCPGGPVAPETIESGKSKRNSEELDELRAELERMYPNWERMSPEDMRVWFAFLRKKRRADKILAGPAGAESEHVHVIIEPKKICKVCRRQSSLIEIYCPGCHARLETDFALMESDVKEKRVSHDFKSRLDELPEDQLVWKARGAGSGNYWSQLCRRAYVGARKHGYDSVPHRFSVDLWYRSSMLKQNYNMETMKEFELKGDPEWRKEHNLAKPLSKKERAAKGIGRWAPNPAMYNDPENRYQGGHDSDYRKRGKGYKKGKDKAKTHAEEHWHTEVPRNSWSDARWEPGHYGGYGNYYSPRPSTRASFSSSSWYESYGHW